MKNFYRNICIIALILSIISIIGIILSNIFSMLAILSYVDNFSGFLTLISVLIAVSVFFYEHWSKNQKHIEKQKNLLRSLLYEIRPLIGKREEMNSQLDWIKKSIFTDHLARKINTNSYITSLDAEIEGKKTEDTIIKLLKIEDKLELINFYVGETRRYVYDIYKKYVEEQKNNKEAKEFGEEWFKELSLEKDMFLISFGKKIQSPVEEAKEMLTELRCIIKERFGIEEMKE